MKIVRIKYSYSTQLLFSVFLIWTVVNCKEGNMDMGNGINSFESMDISAFPVLDQYQYTREFLDVDTMQLIALEETESSYISGIDKLAIFKNSVLIFDRRRQNLMRFELPTGTYLHSFGEIGKGPFEYVDIRHFDINPHDGVVYVYDYAPNKIMVYEISGKGLSTIALPDSIHLKNFIVENDRLIGVLDGSDYSSQDQVKIFNLDDFSVIDSGVRNKYIRSDLNKAIGDYHDVKLHRNTDGVYITEFLNDTVYKVIDDKILPVSQVQFGTLQPAVKYYFDQQATPEQIGQITLGIENYLKLEKYLIISFRKYMPFPQTLMYNAVVNLKNGLNYQFAGAFHPGNYLFKITKYAYENKIVSEINLNSTLEIMKLNCYKSNNSCSRQDSMLIRDMEVLSIQNPDMMNPALLVYSIKE